MSVFLGTSLAIVVNAIASAIEVLVQKGSHFSSINCMNLRNDIRLQRYRVLVNVGQHGGLWGDELGERVYNTLYVVLEEMKKEIQPYEPDKYTCIK